MKVNYQGPDSSTQTWTWQIYDWVHSSYVTIGTNAGAPSWGAWTILTFNVGGTLSNYIRPSDGQIRLQLLSNNNFDNTDIDYEAVVVTSSNGVSVSISPTTATVNGGSTQQFTATVTGSSNTAVTWSLSGLGTLSSSGLYTAPATITSQSTATLTATSQADATKSASATLTLNPTAVSVSISPTSATLTGGGMQQFTATVTGSSNTAVTWSLTGVGTLSTSGLYAAPATVASQTTVTVKATSQADTTKAASATVTINPVAVSVSPTTASLSAGGTQQFTATVTGSSNTAVSWSLSGLGTLPSSGLYTAPANISSQSTATITVTSQADTTKSASATVTLNPTAVSVTISPASATVAPNATEQFTATVTGSNNTAVTWQVNSVAGGNSTTGTVSAGGLYTAPATVPNSPNVTVTAVSQADGTKSASATVTVSNGLAFYVSTTGNDANNGSSSAPWRTIQHAANVAIAGDTINVYGGVYHEAVTINVSGNSTGGYITFQSYPGQTAIIDGTGLTVSGQTGLINIQNQNYLIVNGFEIRNFSTSSTANVPIGIYITGADSYIQILNNHIHDIKTSATGCNANALGMAVYGDNGSRSINNLTISGNQLDHLTTGCSESMSLDGNVQYWTVSNNVIHDNNNIGIDAIGFEGVSPTPATDQARDGSIVGNTVYNITSYGNPAYGNQYAADGIYVDGGTRITIERNVIHDTDLNVELASEHSGKTSSYITVRNNLIYHSNSVGVSIGGYASNVGGTDHCTIVNNTLWNNDSKNTGGGEFQIQYYATNNVFKNNIVYAGTQGLFLNSYTNSESNPVDSDYNVFFSSVGSSSGTWVWNGTTYTGFSSYQSVTRKDPHSPFADPRYVNLTSTPPNLDVQSGSPALNAGINLGSSVVGTQDYAGNPRVNANGQINIGAYEQ